MLFELLGNSAAGPYADNGCHASEGKQMFSGPYFYVMWSVLKLMGHMAETDRRSNNQCIWLQSWFGLWSLVICRDDYCQPQINRSLLL